MDPKFDERLGKQPAWVQDHIRSLNQQITGLESQVEELSDALKAGPEGSNVYAEIGDVPRPLGKDVLVQFWAGGHAYSVTVEDDGLVVDATRNLVIEPVETYKAVLRMKGESR
ncbi:hypothetical protein [Streptomyces sp. NPDC002088]|uniref:DUF7239 family protein n=1 Tax=Streptomyces sp. NPDC002088 TaxID=3154665 RepID=UPI003324DAB4